MRRITHYAAAALLALAPPWQAWAQQPDLEVTMHVVPANGGPDAVTGEIKLPRIGIHQQLVMIETMPRLGIIRPVYPVAVTAAGRDLWQISVPDIQGFLRQPIACQLLGSGRVEQAEINPFGMRREQREVSATAIEHRSKRMHFTWQHRPRFAAH
jgi:hypothetical protein